MGPRPRVTTAGILRLMATQRAQARVFFEHHGESGDSRAVDLDLTTLALVGMCNWAYQSYEPGGELGPDQVAGFCSDILPRGILAESAR